MLLWIYMIYLGGLLAIHATYAHVTCPPDHCGPNPDWFAAAIVDNYAFLAIIVYPILIAYLQLTENVAHDFRDMVMMLAGRGVLRLAPDSVAERAPRARQDAPLRAARSESIRQLDHLDASAHRLGLWLGSVVTLCVAVLVALAVGPLVVPPPDGQSLDLPPWYVAALFCLHVWLAVPLVFMVVYRFGRLFRYSLAAFRYEKHGVVLQPIVEHYDQAGGLKPLGDFFLGQSYRICLITGYLILMTLFLSVHETIRPRMIMVPPGMIHDMHQTLLQGFGLLALFVLVIQLLSLLFPFWTVQKRMIEYKRRLIGRAAVMARRRQRLLAMTEAAYQAGAGAEPLRKELEAAERWIRSYEAFPSLPVPVTSLRNFWIMWGGSIGTALAMLISAVGD